MSDFNTRFETMEKHMKCLIDMVGSLVDNSNKCKYDDEENEMRSKKGHNMC